MRGPAVGEVAVDHAIEGRILGDLLVAVGVASLAEELPLPVLAAIPIFLRQGGGTIVNVGSVLALAVVGHLAPYAASKGGLNTLTKNLANESKKDLADANKKLRRTLESLRSEKKKADAAVVALYPAEGCAEFPELTLDAEWKFNILTDGLGESWRILQCGMKFFPTEALTHAPISATLDLIREHDLAPDDVGVGVHAQVRSRQDSLQLECALGCFHAGL